MEFPKTEEQRKAIAQLLTKIDSSSHVIKDSQKQETIQSIKRPLWASIFLGRDSKFRNDPARYGCGVYSSSRQIGIAVSKKFLDLGLSFMHGKAMRLG